MIYTHLESVTRSAKFSFIKIMALSALTVSCGTKDVKQEQSETQAFVSTSGKKIVGITLKKKGKKPQFCFASLDKKNELELITKGSIDSSSLRKALRRSSYLMTTGKALVVTGLTAIGSVPGVYIGAAGGGAIGALSGKGVEGTLWLGMIYGARAGAVAGGTASAFKLGESIVHGVIGTLTGVVAIIGIVAGAGPTVAIGAAATVSITGFTITERVMRGIDSRKVLSPQNHYISEERYEQIENRFSHESEQFKNSEFQCKDAISSFKKIYIEKK